MADFLLTVVAALVVAGIGFGVAAFTLGQDRGLTAPRPDGVPFDLPSDRPLSATDVKELRFDTVVRGYRMSQVDLVLDQVATDLRRLKAYTDALEYEITALRAGKAPESSYRRELLPAVDSASGSVGAVDSASGSVGAVDSASGSVGAVDSASGSVGAVDSASGSVGAVDSASGSVGADDDAPGAASGPTESPTDVLANDASPRLAEPAENGRGPQRG